MLKKRIIPCLDIENVKTVKGINFLDIKEVGSPIDLAKKYSKQGADELVLLDIKATKQGRSTMVELVRNIAKQINIPFTVGGGISSVFHVSELIESGADKVSINSAGIRDPELLKAASGIFGSQCIVAAIDTKLVDGVWMVYISGGKTETQWTAVDWAQKAVEMGAGEILLTSINSDGTKAGFSLDIINQISQVVDVPIIASGGAGCKEDFEILFSQTKATGGLAASVFHYDEIEIGELKQYLKTKNIAVR